MFFENNKLQLFVWLPKKRGDIVFIGLLVHQRPCFVIYFKIESIKYCIKSISDHGLYACEYTRPVYKRAHCICSKSYLAIPVAKFGPLSIYIRNGSAFFDYKLSDFFFFLVCSKLINSLRADFCAYTLELCQMKNRLGTLITGKKCYFFYGIWLQIKGGHTERPRSGLRLFTELLYKYGRVTDIYAMNQQHVCLVVENIENLSTT